MSGLSEGLENAAVQCSRQRCMVQRMKEELKETREFVEVSIASNPPHSHVHVVRTLQHLQGEGVWKSIYPYTATVLHARVVSVQCLLPHCRFCQSPTRSGRGS